MDRTHTSIDSPIGELTLVAADGVLAGLYFPGHWYMPALDAFGSRSERAVSSGPKRSWPSTSPASAPSSSSRQRQVATSSSARSGS